MTGARVERAYQLAAEIRDALAAADLPDVWVTLDALEVESTAAGGCVIVGAPKLTFETFASVQSAYSVHVMYDAGGNYLVAWDHIDQIITALFDACFNLDTAEPGVFSTAQGGAIPAYTLTLNDLD